MSSPVFGLKRGLYSLQSLQALVSDGASIDLPANRRTPALPLTSHSWGTLRACSNGLLLENTLQKPQQKSEAYLLYAVYFTQILAWIRPTQPVTL